MFLLDFSFFHYFYIFAIYNDSDSFLLPVSIRCIAQIY